jgi:pimeloyl-ACP methyl ester carboxylesterase
VFFLVAAIAGVVYAGCCVVLFALQRSMIYTPQRRLIDRRDCTFALMVDGARLLVSRRTEPGPDAVVYFGGNAEDVAASVPGLVRAFPGRSIYALHYRGYNGSAGKPSEAALIADALALYDLVYGTNPHIVVIGRSLGSGVAIHVAALRGVERLVLVTPYNSLEELAAQRFPLFPISWLMLDKFESWRYAPQVTDAASRSRV